MQTFNNVAKMPRPWLDWIKNRLRSSKIPLKNDLLTFRLLANSLWLNVFWIVTVNLKFYLSTSIQRKTLDITMKTCREFLINNLITYKDWEAIKVEIKMFLKRRFEMRKQMAARSFSVFPISLIVKEIFWRTKEMQQMKWGNVVGIEFQLSHSKETRKSFVLNHSSLEK